MYKCTHEHTKCYSCDRGKHVYVRGWCACKDGTCFFRIKDSKRVWFMAQWLKVEPKQSTLFFKTFISFSILEDKVEHAIGVLDEEATLAWQTLESKSFFKDLFLFKTKNKSCGFDISDCKLFKLSYLKYELYT